MKYDVKKIVYPEGDIQDIPHDLRINQIVDLNGYPLTFPLKSAKMIAFRVYKKSTKETSDENITFFYLEQVPVYELEEYR